MTGSEPCSSEVMVAVQAAIVDRTTARVATALRNEGIRSILLKGPVLAHWLYDDSSRAYLDADLLVSPADVCRTEAVLAGLGYARVLGDADIPPFDRQLHAHTWCPARGPSIDLHRTLAGALAPATKVWAALSEGTVMVEVDGAPVEALGMEARAVTVVLHAAHHGPRERKPLEDLSRALEALDREGWRSAARLAERLGASEGFAAGLRMLPAGSELAATLAMPEPSSVEVALRTTAPAPLALHLEWLHQARGARSKARLLLRLLFPPRAFMDPAPGARRPRAALARAYLVRIGKLRHGPAALLAWQRARRKMR